MKCTGGSVHLSEYIMNVIVVTACVEKHECIFYLWGNTYHWGTYITVTHSAQFHVVICVRGMHITRDMCSGEHVSWGNTYHCNSGSGGGGVAATRAPCLH